MNTQLNQFNQSLKRNGKTLIMEGKSIKGIVKELSDGVNGIDTKQLCSVEPLRQGEILSYNGINYMIVTKNENVNGVYSIYTMRNCPYNVKMFLNSVLNLYPMYCDSQSFDLSSPTTGAVGIIPTKTMMLTIPNTVISNTIQLGQIFIKFYSAWKVTGIDKTVDGLITFTCDFSMGGGDNYIDEIPEGIVPIIPKEPVYKLTVEPFTVSIITGNTTQITSTATKDDVAIVNPTITYGSSDSSIATISSTGLITGMSKGNCTITVNYRDISKKITTVISEATPLHNYVLSVIPTNATIDIGATTQLVGTVTDNGVEVVSPVITYSSSDNSAATVDTNGLVTGINGGVGTITVSYVGEDSITYKSTVSITINVPVVVGNDFKITITPLTTPLAYKGYMSLEYILTNHGVITDVPSDYEFAGISSNDRIISCSGTNITNHKMGTATITLGLYKYGNQDDDGNPIFEVSDKITITV